MSFPSVSMPSSDMIIQQPTTGTKEPITRKFIDIQPITISDKESERLQALIDTNTKRNKALGTSTKAQQETIQQIKYRYLKNIVKTCTRCGNLAEYIVNYKIDGVGTLFYRYCSKCLDDEKEKIEQDY